MCIWPRCCNKIGNISKIGLTADGFTRIPVWQVSAITPKFHSAISERWSSLYPDDVVRPLKDMQMYHTVTESDEDRILTLRAVEGDDSFALFIQVVRSGDPESRVQSIQIRNIDNGNLLREVILTHDVPLQNEITPPYILFDLEREHYGIVIPSAISSLLTPLRLKKYTYDEEGTYLGSAERDYPASGDNLVQMLPYYRANTARTHQGKNSLVWVKSFTPSQPTISVFKADFSPATPDFLPAHKTLSSITEDSVSGTGEYNDISVGNIANHAAISTYKTSTTRNRVNLVDANTEAESTNLNSDLPRTGYTINGLGDLNTITSVSNQNEVWKYYASAPRELVWTLPSWDRTVRPGDEGEILPNPYPGSIGFSQCYPVKKNYNFESFYLLETAQAQHLKYAHQSKGIFGPYKIVSGEIQDEQSYSYPEAPGTQGYTSVNRTNRVEHETGIIVSRNPPLDGEAVPAGGKLKYFTLE